MSVIQRKWRQDTTVVQTIQSHGGTHQWRSVNTSGGSQPEIREERGSAPWQSARETDGSHLSSWSVVLVSAVGRWVREKSFETRSTHPPLCDYWRASQSWKWRTSTLPWTGHTPSSRTPHVPSYSSWWCSPWLRNTLWTPPVMVLPRRDTVVSQPFQDCTGGSISSFEWEIKITVVETLENYQLCDFQN